MEKVEKINLWKKKTQCAHITDTETPNDVKKKISRKYISEKIYNIIKIKFCLISKKDGVFLHFKQIKSDMTH